MCVSLATAFPAGAQTACPVPKKEKSRQDGGEASFRGAWQGFVPIGGDERGDGVPRDASGFPPPLHPDDEESGSSGVPNDDYRHEKRWNELQDPIDVRTGNKRHEELDHTPSGPAPLRIWRTYNSLASAAPAVVRIPMGAGWRSGFDRSVQVLSASLVRLHRDSGDTEDFSLSSGLWSSTQGKGALTSVSGGWRYVNAFNVVETYDSTGRLSTLSQEGRVQTLAYNAANQLTSVSDAFGRSLVFAYDAAGRVSTITLPGGTWVGYTYGANNNLVAARAADAKQRLYAYESTSFPNALTGITDEAGRRWVTWGYDSAGRANMGYYGANVDRLDIVYATNVVTTTDSRGTQRVRTYGTVAGKTVIAGFSTLGSGSRPTTSWSFLYDANGHPLRSTSRTGEVHEHVADARGRTTSRTRALGQPIALSATTTWHASCHVPTQVVGQGITTTYTVDADCRVTQVQEASSVGTRTTLSRTYLPQGLLQSQTDVRGATVVHGYDAAGNRSSSTVYRGPGLTNLVGTTTYAGYNSLGQPTSITRPDGVVLSLSYDARGRLLSQTESFAGVSRSTTYTLDDAGLVTRETAADGAWVGYAYNAARQVQTVNNHRAEQALLDRDVAGKLTAVRVFNAGGTQVQGGSVAFDGVGRLATATDARGFAATVQYAADGRYASTTDAAGRQYSAGFDLLDRLATTTQPNTTEMRNLGGPATVGTSHGYSPGTGNHSSSTDTAGITTSYGFDAFRQRLTETNVDAGNSSTPRSLAGDIASRTDPRNIALTVGRDGLGRITSLTPPGGTTAPHSYTYTTNRESTLLASMTDASGSTTWSHNAAGQLLSKTQTVAGIARTLAVSRDSFGRITTLTYPSGMTVGYTYANGALSSLSVNGATVLHSITYRPLSDTISGWTWSNGTTHVRTFDNDGRTTSVKLGPRTRSYSYNNLGQVSGFSDSSGSASFTYDEAGQLKSYTGPQGNGSFSYDANGNRKSEVVNGTARSYTYQANSNRLHAISNGLRNYSYNADGSPLTDGVNRLGYAYDAFGRLVEATPLVLNAASQQVLSAYNGLGQRVYKERNTWSPEACAECNPYRAPAQGKSELGSELGTSASTKTTTASKEPLPGWLPKPYTVPSTGPALSPAPTSPTRFGPAQASTLSQNGSWVNTAIAHFFYDEAGQLLGEYGTPTNANQETVWLGSLPVATVRAGTVYHVHPDHLGTPRSLTQAGNGAEVWRWDSEPFGTTAPTVNGSGSPSVAYHLRLPGQYLDTETGLHYNGMRDYDPRTGRYLQADPIGLQGGWARYTYVAGDPLGMMDPFGLKWFRGRDDSPAVGRPGTWVPPDGAIARTLEFYVPAMYEMGIRHDRWVDTLTGLGFPDRVVNVPTMAPAYVVSVGSELKRSVQEFLWDMTKFLLDGGPGAKKIPPNCP
jgi:RHS repeat-associated protein